MTRSYKSFRKEGFSVRPEAYYRKKNGEPMTSQEKREKDLDIEKQSREDFSSLLELRDISDELHTIQKLFKEQRGILIDTARYYLNGEGTGEMKNPKTFIREAVEAVEPQKRDENGLNYLAETERSLNSFERSVSEMADSAESTEQAVSLLHPVSISSTDRDLVQQSPRHKAKASECGRISTSKVSNGRYSCARQSYHDIHYLHHYFCKLPPLVVIFHETLIIAASPLVLHFGVWHECPGVV